MALSDRVSTRPAATHGSPCSVGALLNQLESDEHDALTTMLGTPEQRGWAAGDIYDAVTAEGYTVSYQQINRHRGGKCRCFRAAA